MALYLRSEGLQMFYELLAHEPTERCIGAAVVQLNETLSQAAFMTALHRRFDVDLPDLITKTGNQALLAAELSAESDEVTKVMCASCGHCALIGINPPSAGFDHTVQPGQTPCDAVYKLRYDHRRQALKTL